MSWDEHSRTRCDMCGKYCVPYDQETPFGTKSYEYPEPLDPLDAAKKMGMTYLPTLVGVVDYKFTFAEGHHQTGFILDLRKRDVANPNIALHFDIQEGTVPRSRLWLIQGFMSVPPD